MICSQVSVRARKGLLRPLDSKSRSLAKKKDQKRDQAYIFGVKIRLPCTTSLELSTYGIHSDLITNTKHIDYHINGMWLSVAVWSWASVKVFSWFGHGISEICFILF